MVGKQETDNAFDGLPYRPALGVNACNGLAVDPENPYGLRGHFGPHLKCFAGGRQRLSLDSLSQLKTLYRQIADDEPA